MDIAQPTKHYIAALLERSVKVLIYVGKYDWVCNHVGNEAWTLALEWSGHDEFSTQSLREWKIDGRAVGTTRSAKGLTFVTIDGAGHMVRYRIVSFWGGHYVLLTRVFLFRRSLMINPRKLWNSLIGG